MTVPAWDWSCLPVNFIIAVTEEIARKGLTAGELFIKKTPNCCYKRVLAIPTILWHTK